MRFIPLKNSHIVLGQPGKVFVVAEAGYNHEGNFDLARRLVLDAKKAGADAIKFQIVKADQFVPRNIQRSRDEERIMRDGDNLYRELKRSELSEESYRELAKLARKEEILFFASFTEKETADFLLELGVPLFKLASGEVTNLPFLEYAAGKEVPLILSTGMATLSEVEGAVKVILSTGNQNLCLLHSTSCYPTRSQDANLRAIRTLQQTFPNFPIGYSDHTLGFLAPVLAVSLGAVIVEKHFTLDKTRPGADHNISMEPEEFTQMVQGIRQVEILLGNSEKIPCQEEQAMRILARRSLVVCKALSKGEIFTVENLDLMRPAQGLAPSYWSMVLGKRAGQDLAEGEILTLDKVEWA